MYNMETFDVNAQEIRLPGWPECQQTSDTCSHESRVLFCVDCVQDDDDDVDDDDEDEEEEVVNVYKRAWLTTCGDNHADMMCDECTHPRCVDDRTRCRSNRHRFATTPRPIVGDGNVRKELSVTTVLFALLAIARSRCLLLTTPLSRSGVKALALLGVTLVLACVLAPASAQMSPKNADVFSRPEEGVCQSVDIRNNVEQFSALRGCRVIEGFLQILLIDHALEKDYDNLSFPELREITGYLLLYRATGLRSLSKIFPNLSVIRGNTLFFNYALVSYEMLHLQDLGLHSLTDILRGSVRIEKNPLLCFVDTIEWDMIAKAGKGGHFIKGNRLKNECPMCPTSNDTELKCPQRPASPATVPDPLCWNRQNCQKVCPDKCMSRSCDLDGVHCCDENCLGGCHSNTSREPDKSCYVCKDVNMFGRCIKKCPDGFYVYLNRRCVREEDCYKMPVPRDDLNINKNTTWKPFNNTCILDCPAGYEEKLDNKRHKCVQCSGPCRKECVGGNVDSIASAQKLRGCTHIKGDLEIEITGGKNIVKELEENLNMIEEIEGYLKVVRSFPLISLNFLKRLRVIQGSTLESNKYSLVVLDNQNLQELWNWSSVDSFKINNGKISFHYNPKLCIYKIKRLNQVAFSANPQTYTELEVAPTSNGDKVSCNVTALIVKVERVGTHGALISWKPFEHYDERSLLGYVVYSIEAPYNNLTLYDSRDACGSDGWLVDDVEHDQTTQLLSKLKPFTQYAFYVKTYMIATEDNGAISNIHYLTTEPDVPTVPQSLKVSANSSTQLVIKWQPPNIPNGNITYYIVSYTKESDNHTILYERNYCKEPITQLDKKPHLPVQEEEEKTTPNACSCEDKTAKAMQEKESEQKIWSIHFEDVLQNQIYVKRDSSRKRRSIDWYENRYKRMTNDSFASYNFLAEDATTIERRVNKSTILVINNLSHYGLYTIRVKACREMSIKEKEENKTESCSSTSIDSGRTNTLDGADDIARIEVVDMSNHSLGMVKLLWEEPMQPNGLIVTYQIEYQRMDIENYKPTVECITQNQYISFKGSYTLKNLLPGNYSVHIRATSLAGNGAYSKKEYFLITESGTPKYSFWIIAVFIIICILFLVGLWVYRRKCKPDNPNMKLIASVNPEYMSIAVYVPDEWEVPRKKVELLRELGQGSFGMVYEGIGRDITEGQPEIRCAIKTVGENATDRERSEFLNEASVMKTFHTHHVVQLLGVVSQGQPVLVVMELMPRGDLKTYLRSHRPDTGGDQSIQPPTLKRILQMAIEIADGMAYLSAKKFVHRDLAARNCMVAEDLTVKIGDFGMTRDIYETDYYRKGTRGLLPVRWMAPESLKDGVFTSRSDAWSYGVVLWEMATLASQPYQGLSNDQVLRYVIDGGVMERPENCPDRLYELMRLCWQHKPLGRPHFLELVTILLADINSDFDKVSFYHSKEGSEGRAHLAEIAAAAALDDNPATPLRISREIEDFSLDDDEDPFEVTAHSPSTSNNANPALIQRYTIPPLSLSNDQVIVSLNSNGNKLGNGSTVTSPSTANGWIANHQNDTDISNASNSSLKTTEC